LNHQCVDVTVFGKISKPTTIKPVRYLVKTYGGADKTKKVKFLPLRRQ